MKLRPSQLYIVYEITVTGEETGIHEDEDVLNYDDIDASEAFV